MVGFVAHHFYPIENELYIRFNGTIEGCGFLNKFVFSQCYHIWEELTY
jgi:hypothetical protein